MLPFITTHVCLGLLFLCQLVKGANVALGAQPSQVDTYAGYTADIAVDGLKTDCRGGISFSQTLTHNNPWWTVDLKQRFNINKADVYIRDQGNNNSSRGTYRLLVGTHPYSIKPSSFKLCAEQTIGQSNRGTFNCGRIIGRYVTVIFKQNTSPLSLCEVEVYGTKNLALKAQASQLDTYYSFEDKLGFTADRAVDGLKSLCGDYSRFTHTMSHNNPWLMVDLHEPFNINKVLVYIRDAGKDIESQYRGTYRVLVGAHPYTTKSSSSQICGEQTIGVSNYGTFTCGSLVGRYVTVVFLKTTQPLCLCEVEVYEAPESSSRDGCAAETGWIDKSTLLMDAEHKVWPSGFCRVQLPLDVSGSVVEYEFTARLYNIRPFTGHPGVMYNVQDLNNYDMLYFRPYSSDACYQTGYVEDGLEKWEGATSGACNGGAAPHNAWFTVKVKVVNGTTARLYKDGSLIATTNFHFSLTPKVGLNIPNRYGNKVKGDSFMLTACLQDSI